jgi:hypothetical protein
MAGGELSPTPWGTHVRSPLGGRPASFASAGGRPDTPSLDAHNYYVAYNVPEDDDELHAPEKGWKMQGGRIGTGSKGRHSFWSGGCSVRGMLNVFTIIFATLGIAGLFIAYPISSFLLYQEKIDHMEGLGMAVEGSNQTQPKQWSFNGTGQL